MYYQYYHDYGGHHNFHMMKMMMMMTIMIIIIESCKKLHRESNIANVCILLSKLQNNLLLRELRILTGKKCENSLFDKDTLAWNAVE